MNPNTGAHDLPPLPPARSLIHSYYATLVKQARLPARHFLAYTMRKKTANGGCVRATTSCGLRLHARGCRYKNDFATAAMHERISPIFPNPTRQRNKSTTHDTKRFQSLDKEVALLAGPSIYTSSFQAARVGAPISMIGCGTVELSKQLSSQEIRPSSSRVSRSHTTIGFSCPASLTWYSTMYLLLEPASLIASKLHYIHRGMHDTTAHARRRWRWARGQTRGRCVSMGVECWLV